MCLASLPSEPELTHGYVRTLIIHQAPYFCRLPTCTGACARVMIVRWTAPVLAFETVSLLPNQTDTEGSPLFSPLHSSCHVLFLHCAFWRLMIYCDVNVRFISLILHLCLNKQCAHSVRCMQDTAGGTLLSVSLASIFFSSLKMC